MRVELNVRVVKDGGEGWDFESHYRLDSLFGMPEAMKDFGAEALRFLTETESRHMFRSEWNVRRLQKKVK